MKWKQENAELRKLSRAGCPTPNSESFREQAAECRSRSKTIVLVLVLLLVLAPFGRAGNDNIVNPASSPVRVRIYPDPSATPQPVTTTTATATTVKSTAFEASHVLKASAGRLCSLQVFNSSVSAQYILVMDSATVPANGAVTLLCPPIYLAAGTYIQIPFPIPLSATNGISVSNSSTGTFTKTIGSADCAFTAQVQ